MSDETTHYENCWQSGAKHYECALMEITVLRKRLQTETQLLLDGNKIASKAHREEVADLRNQLEKKAWFSAYEKKEWVGLTDEEFHDLQIEHGDDPWANFKAIEAKSKEKNT